MITWVNTPAKEVINSVSEVGPDINIVILSRMTIIGTKTTPRDAKKA